MSTVAEILQVRSPLEESLRLWFVANGIFAATRQNLEFQKETPRVEIKCMVGAVTGHMNPCPDGVLRYDGWRLNLSLQLITAVNPDDLTAHEQFTGLVRSKCSVAAAESWNDLTNFPHLLIAEHLRDAGTQDKLKTEQGFEYSVLTYSGIISIRKGAWPQP